MSGLEVIQSASRAHNPSAERYHAKFYSNEKITETCDRACQTKGKFSDLKKKMKPSKKDKASELLRTGLLNEQKLDTKES